jgi:hypothetical protein
MKNTYRSRLKNFRKFLADSKQDPHVITFTVLFPEEPLTRPEADLLGAEVGSWIVDSTEMTHGDVMLIPVEASGKVVGFDVQVTASDTKSVSLLQAHLMNGTIGVLGESVGQGLRVSEPRVRRFLSF